MMQRRTDAKSLRGLDRQLEPRRKSPQSLLLLGGLLIACLAAFASLFAAETTAFSVTVDASQAQPRPVEETTSLAVQRDYSHAWQVLAQAMEENRAELLGAGFAGIARDKLAQAISEQRNHGLKRRYIDHGHRVRVVFYSIDGSAMELQDTASLEIQLLDGNKIVHSEQTAVRYVALLTPAENSWKVRVLESVPGF